MSSEIQSRPIVMEMLKGIRRIRTLIENENGPLSEASIREIHGVCEELVRLSSKRPSEIST